MPLGEGFYGSEESGKDSRDYCKFCYCDGQFTDPQMTVVAMVNRSATHMMEELHMEEEMARQVAEETIPMLRRWRESHTS